MTLAASLSVRRGPLRLAVDIEVGEGEVAAVLGPNGAGKSTMLAAVAGLLPIGEGRVVLDGKVLEDTALGTRLSPQRRPVGVVFQERRLFPHLSVLDNVAFGLRTRGEGRATARRRAEEWLARLGLTELAGGRPEQLSGGQAQLAALARALATKPRLLLLDEPLAALDVATRAEVRRELVRHLRSFAGTRLLVTHDPLEAMALADRLLVLEEGRIVQSGTPADVRERPRSRYAADLVGVNLFRGRARAGVVELPSGGRIVVAGAGVGEVFAVVHPRSVALHRQDPEGSPRNVWRATAERVDVEGDRVRVLLGGSVPLVAEVTPAAADELRLAEGGPVWATVKATEVVAYPA